MIAYLYLQFKILNRRIVDFGFPLVAGYVLMLFAFIFVSNKLFENTEFPEYAYGLIAIITLSRLNEPKRNDFLKSIFLKTVYRKTRIVENTVCALPFTFFLIYKNKYFFCVLLNVFLIIISFLSFKSNINIAIPTPFGKKPFEFTIGFRKTFYVFPIAYFLAYTSVMVENFNLGIFSMLLIAITCLSYYSNVEDKYFVWNYNLSTKEFLYEKIKTCLINFSFLNLPIVIILSICFFNEIDALVMFVFLIYAYLLAIVLAKYSVFPNTLHLPQGMLFALSFIFPPLLLAIIPIFYSQSIKKINKLLK